ncbi:hypothetical protein [Variovorax sp. UC122_21]|uniref:hypothetical protein n=1 Tax=Variovorax TaxID=34072 RepID=UPI001934AB9E|nr:hypothetical protein INQ48_35360 [Variovorax paradoxus]
MRSLSRNRSMADAAWPVAASILLVAAAVSWAFASTIPPKRGGNAVKVELPEPAICTSVPESQRNQ